MGRDRKVVRTSFLLLLAQKKKTHVRESSIDSAQKVPRSFIIHRGNVSKDVLDLVTDLRQMMLPYTAEKLKVSRHASRSNNAGQEGKFSQRLCCCLRCIGCLALAGSQRGKYVATLCCLIALAAHTHLRLMKLPRGPTLHFRVDEFSLCPAPSLSALMSKAGTSLRRKRAPSHRDPNTSIPRL